MKQIIKRTSVLTLCAAILIGMGFNSRILADTGIASERYEVISQTYADKGIQISYPQVTGMTDVKKQEKINAQLKGDALRPLGYFPDLSSVGMDINYEIKLQNSHILSIVFSGTTDTCGGSHPVGQFYTTNINVTTGKKLRLRDLVSIDDNFMKNIKQGNLIANSPQVTWGKLSSADAELKRAFNEADGIGHFDVNSYYTESSVGINICVEHAYGDNAQLEVNYQAIRPNLKGDNEHWKDILHNKL